MVCGLDVNGDNHVLTVEVLNEVVIIVEIEFCVRNCRENCIDFCLVIIVGASCFVDCVKNKSKTKKLLDIASDLEFAVDIRVVARCCFFVFALKRYFIIAFFDEFKI